MSGEKNSAVVRRLSEKWSKNVGSPLAAFVILLLTLSPGWAAAPLDGATLYKQHCASCHDGNVPRAPKLDRLREMTPEAVLNALEMGPMKFVGLFRPLTERRAIATFVTGKEFGNESASETQSGYCAQAPGDFAAPAHGPQWNGWSTDVTNTRFQSVEQAGFTAEQVPNLKVKWVFGLPPDSQASQPTVVGGRVFIASMRGRVYSLDAATGCLYWSIKTLTGVRTAVSVGPLPGTKPPRYAAYFGDVGANVYAVDARSGEKLWTTQVETHPMARLTGAPVLYGNRLYVPISSFEEGAGGTPTYECCTFRGNVVALEAKTGKQIWKAYTIPQKPIPTQKNKIGTQLWGPSGAAVWAAPTIDSKRGVLYVTTGDNYSDPPSQTSDAIVAFDLKSGKFLWSQQFTAKDAFNVGCGTADTTNCPGSNGPDLDFGSSAILRTLPDGKQVLLAGQKAGVLHAVDPDQKGAVLWQQRVGQGGLLGGIQWGPAADEDTIYVALSDIGVKFKTSPEIGTTTELDGKVGGGLFAFRLGTGEKAWATPPPGCGERKNCSPAQSAAITVIPGAVFSGSVDGHLRAYSTQDGRVVWDYDAAQEYQTVNGMKANGGSFDGPGPTVAGGMLYVNSGYSFWGGMPGNVLLAFSVDGK